MRPNGIIVAIDGPAGAGKSTTAKAVARRLGYLYLDTGAMYRVVALATLRAEIDPEQSAMVEEMLSGLTISQSTSDSGTRTFLNEEDVSDLIRTQDVANAASQVAVHPAVRNMLVRLQKDMGATGGIVLEGRDTTTAIFPDAELKVFLEATVEARAERRLKENAESGIALDPEQLKQEIQARDDRDRQTQSQHGPWPSPDAVRVDTTGLSIDQQVDHITGLALENGAGGAV